MTNSAKRNEVKAGDYLKTDESFSCMYGDEVKQVFADGDGLYINCSHGRHYLEGQLDEDGTYVGLSLHRSITNS